MAFKFTELDTGSTLKVTCKDDATGVVIDITGFTVQLLYKIGSSVLQTKTMTITDGSNGIATYKFLAAELLAGASSLPRYEVSVGSDLAYEFRDANQVTILIKLYHRPQWSSFALTCAIHAC